MNLTRNVTALYASQVYAIVVSIAVTPLFLRALGAEGYGLVGIYLLVQTWLQMLDLGAPMLLSRLMARWRAGAASAADLRGATRFLEVVFAAVGALAAALLILAVELIAQRWLDARELPRTTLHEALVVIAVVSALRWMVAPYRAVIAGAEQLRWLAGMGVVFPTLRFVAVLPWVIRADEPVRAFFSAQLVLAFVELGAMARKAYSLLPDGSTRSWPRGLALLGSGGVGLGGSMAMVTVVWLLTTQVDRLILSRVLTLADFGYLTLATTVAGAIVQATGPLLQAVTPRLVFLNSTAHEAELRDTYLRLTLAVTAVAACLGTVFVAQARAVLFVWTGDAAVAAAVAPTLAAYAGAQALLSVTGLPYTLQLARGDLRLHLSGSIVMLALLAPSVAWAGQRWGAPGAGLVWIAVLLLWLAGWAPIAHRSHAPGLHRGWLVDHLLKVAAPAVIVGIGSSLAGPYWPPGRLAQALLLALTAAGSAAATLALVPGCRQPARSMLEALGWHVGSRREPPPR